MGAVPVNQNMTVRVNAWWMTDVRNHRVACDSQIKELVNVQKQGAGIPDA